MLVSGATALEKELLACRIVFWYVPRCPRDLPLLPGGGNHHLDVANDIKGLIVWPLFLVFWCRLRENYRLGRSGSLAKEEVYGDYLNSVEPNKTDPVIVPTYAPPQRARLTTLFGSLLTGSARGQILW